MKLIPLLADVSLHHTIAQLIRAPTSRPPAKTMIALADGRRRSCLIGYAIQHLNRSFGVYLTFFLFILHLGILHELVELSVYQTRSQIVPRPP